MSELYPTSSEDIEQDNYSESGGKVRYSYDEIHELVRGGASMLREANFTPDYIISIAGGGLIPARMLRTYVDVPILNMTVTSYEGDSHTPTQDPVILQSIDPEIIKNGTEIREQESLSARWVEVVAGIKVKMLNNIYMGFSLRLNRLMSDTRPENFDNLYIPGFNKKTDENVWGAGFNYTLTYAIPVKI